MNACNAKCVAWLMPEFDEGSGGVRTILQNVEYLEKRGFSCDLYVGSSVSQEVIRKKIIDSYSIGLKGDIYCDYNLRRRYDIEIATYYATAEIVANSDCKCKLYFIQDYEPWFFPMSQNYLDAMESYKLGLNGVSIGKWLAKKINDDSGMTMGFFGFCADLSIYKPLKNAEKENAICFIFQPDKPRRMVDLGLKALQIVQHEQPTVKIFLYGSEKMKPHNLNASHLGLISPSECNDLYNRCRVGLCLSATNPSRIPFEMMAAGLPVVEVYGENTVYDLPDDGCLLAERTPESLAKAMLKVLNDNRLRNELVLGGERYMKRRSLEVGFAEFERTVLGFCDGKCIDRRCLLEKCYRRKAVKDKRSSKWVDLGNVYFTPIDNRSAVRKKLSRIKNALFEDV